MVEKNCNMDIKRGVRLNILLLRRGINKDLAIDTEDDNC